MEGRDGVKRDQRWVKILQINIWDQESNTSQGTVKVNVHTSMKVAAVNTRSVRLINTCRPGFDWVPTVHAVIIVVPGNKRAAESCYVKVV